MEGRTRRGRREGSVLPAAADASLRARLFPAGTEKGNRLPETEGGPGSGKRPPSLLPMLGAPAGRSPAPLLLLQLLARPLSRQEAGPALRSCPSRAQAGRGGASIRPRRSPDSPVSAAVRKRRQLLALGLRRSRGSGRALPRPSRRRLSHPRSHPQGGGICRFVLAAGSNPERRPSLGARPSPLLHRLPF